MFKSRANVRDDFSSYGQGSGGITVSLNAVSKKKMYLHSLHGFSDTKGLIEITNPLTGLFTTISGHDIVDHSGAKIDELEVGYVIRLTATNELLKIVEFVDNKSFRVTPASSYDNGDDTAVRMIGRYYTVAQAPFNFYINGGMWSSVGQPINVYMYTETENGLTVTGFIV